MSASDPVVVDTDAYTLLFIRRDSADPRVPEWRARLAGRRVLASFQTRAEVLALSTVNMWGDRRAGELRAQLDRTPMIGLDESVVEAYATLVGQCRRAGHPLHQKQHTADRWVAACAIAKGIRLLSGDNIFERTPGLPLLRGTDDV